jgi:hypothetical protein
MRLASLRPIAAEVRCYEIQRFAQAPALSLKRLHCRFVV